MESYDNNLIKEAINHYSHFYLNQKKVLSILIDMEIDGQVVATINDILQASDSTRATVSTAIAFLNKYGIIKNTNTNGVKFTGCQIIPSKLNEIIAHYNKKKNLIKK